MIAGPPEVALIAEPGAALHRVALAGTSPGLVVAVSREPSERPALLAGRGALGGLATAYVCRGFTCQLPTTDPAVLRRQVEARLAVLDDR